MRSSATAEDLPDASFAGQQETYLNISGRDALLDACKRCYASLFTDRAISYRQTKGFEQTAVALSIGVQMMVRSDRGGSGVMFSIDTETGFDKVVVINAAWGLGENVVQGAVDPDEYLVFKPLLANPSLCPIVEKKCGAKTIKMIYGKGDCSELHYCFGRGNCSDMGLCDCEPGYSGVDCSIEVKCQYWDHANSTWSSQGCVQAPPPSGPDGLLHCDCNHLTDSGNWLLQSSTLITWDALTASTASLHRLPDLPARMVYYRFYIHVCACSVCLFCRCR